MLGHAAAAALRCYVAFVVIVAALGKVRQPLVFEAELGAYRLLPTLFVAPTARVLPLFELALGAALLLQRFTAAVSYCAAALLVLFAAAIAINLGRGRRHISCGCGGSVPDRPISESLVIANLAVAALLVGFANVAGPAGAMLNAGVIVAAGGAYLLVQVLAMMRALVAPLPARAVGKG
jgi:hypothetical protein